MSVAVCANGRALTTLRTASGKRPTAMKAPARNPMTVPTIVARAEKALVVRMNEATNAQSAANARQASTIQPTVAAICGTAITTPSTTNR